MTDEEVIRELKALSDEKSKATLLKHGAREPFYAVKIEDNKEAG